MRDLALEKLLSRRRAVKALSEALGISSAAVSQWKRVPKKRVHEVAAALNVPLCEVRPDLFGSPPAASAETEAAA